MVQVNGLYVSSWRRVRDILCVVFAVVCLAACAAHNGNTHTSAADTSQRFSRNSRQQKKKNTLTPISVEVNGRNFTLDIENNAAVKALLADLSNGEVSVSVSAYGGFEQVGDYGKTLPAKDRQQTAQPGDVMLYQGDKLVFFYGTNSWAYTKIGHISDSGFTDALRSNPQTITLRAQ